MDLTDPARRGDTFARLVAETARERGIAVTRVAAAALATPPPGWRGDLADVDEDRLREALAAVLAEVRPARYGAYRAGGVRSVGRIGIAAAARRAKCHYLWLC